MTGAVATFRCWEFDSQFEAPKVQSCCRSESPWAVAVSKLSLAQKERSDSSYESSESRVHGTSAEEDPEVLSPSTDFKPRADVELERERGQVRSG